MSKKANPSKRTKYQIELSSTSLLFWAVLVFFFMGWIFVLGVLLGRGFLPGANTAIADLNAQVTKLKEIVSRNKLADQKSQPREDIDSKLGFYDKLERPPEPSKSEKAVGPSDRTLAHVRADIAKKEASSKKKDVVENAGSGPFRYVIQIAALDEKAKAEDMVRKLSQRGVDAYVQETVVKGKQYYRVRCGKFMTKEEAALYGSKLPKEAGTAWRVVFVE